MNSNTTFLRKSDTSRTASGPRIHLAAFGKHPGWDDHMDDIGLETEALLLTKKMLYTEGIRGQLEANDPHSWNQLEQTQPEALRAKFGHVFLWQRGISLVVGRFWSSRDGKGRTHYPMIICAHTINVPLQWIVERVLPRLAEAEQDCTATESADAVRTAIGRHLAALKSELAAAQTEAMPEPGLEKEMEKFLSHPELGPERQGLLRVLYEVRTRMLPFERGGSQKGEPAKATQTRLPFCAGSVGEAFVLWRRFFEVQLASGTQLLFLAPDGEAWLDVTVGEPSTAEFFCLRANLAAIPLATSVPYKIPDLLKEKCDQLVAALVKGIPSAPLPAQTSKDAPSHTNWWQKITSSGGGKASLLAVAFLAIGLAVGVPLLRRDSPKTLTPSTKSGGASQDTAAARADPTTPGPTKKPQAASQPVLPPPQTAKSAAKQSLNTAAIATAPAPAVPVPSPAPIAPKPSTEIRAAAAPPAKSPTPQTSAPSSNTQQATPKPGPTVAATPPSVSTTVPPVLAESVPKAPPAAALPPVDVPPTVAPPTRTPEGTSPTPSPVILAAKSTPQSPATAPAATPAVTEHDLKNSLGMKFVWIPGLAGTAKGGWVGKHEVTQELFEKVMGRNPSVHDQARAAAAGYQWSPQLPVENLGHQAATEFCDRLTQKEREAGNLPAGWVYALPTQAQWNFFLGDSRWEDAVTSREQPYGQELKAPFKVGQKTPNQFGLHDVLGNVWEWCRDDHGGSKPFKGSAFNSRKVISLNKLEPTYAGLSTGGAVPAGAFFSGSVGFRCVVVPQP